MKSAKNINYRLVLERLQIAYFSIKLIKVIVELWNVAFNYDHKKSTACLNTKGGFQNLKSKKGPGCLFRQKIPLFLAEGSKQL